MPATNGDRKGVRFAVQDGMEEGESDHHPRRRGEPPPPPRTSHRPADDDSGGRAPSALRESQAGEGRHRSKKLSRLECNVDEIDDVDDWRPEDDADVLEGVGGAVLSERALLEAKRLRRLKRVNRLKNGDEIDMDDDEDDDAEVHTGADVARREANRWDRNVGASLLDADDNDGIPITPFNMDQEENDGDGYFDGDTYVFRRGGGRGKDDEEPDAWADASDDDDEFNVAAAVKPAAATESARRGPNLDDWTDRELYARIVPLVSDSETVTAAIVRYGGLIRHQSKRAGSASGASQNGAAAAAVSASSSSLPASSSLRAQEALNELTEASSALLLKGQVDIYQKTRTDLLRLLDGAGNGEREKPTGGAPQQDDSTRNKKKAVRWEYMGNEDKQIHGPFTSDQMRQWISAGYFVGASAVQVRPIFAEESGEEGTTLQDDLMNDLMDDDDDDGNANGDDDQLKPAAKEQVRGEWQQSDRVDFRQFD
jgi:CD2 antigen cytoplasmic tail-binding protein 2